MRRSQDKATSQKNLLSILETLYKGGDDSDWNDRYGEKWKTTCSLTHRATDGVCVCCMKAPSKIVHHMIYSDSCGAIKNRELPGVHVIPVCENCHTSICHAPLNWIKNKTNPKLLNRNTDVFITQMMSQFLKLQDKYNATKHIR